MGMRRDRSTRQAGQGLASQSLAQLPLLHRLSHLTPALSLTEASAFPRASPELPAVVPREPVGVQR